MRNVLFASCVFAAHGLAISRPPLLAEVVAGFAGGAIKTALFYPLDTLTTNAEVARTASIAPEPRGGQQGARSLYRGLGVSLVLSLPYACAFHTINWLAASWLLACLPALGPDATTALAASAGSIAATAVGVPLEYLKHRAQVRAPGFETLGASIASAIARPHLLYTGFQSTLARNVPYNVAHFGLFALLSRLSFAAGPGAIGPLCGALTGACVAFLTQPMDLLNTRRQVGTAGGEGSSGVISSLRRISRREGVGALFRGWRPRCAHYTASSAVFFSIFSTILERWPPAAAV